MAPLPLGDALRRSGDGDDPNPVAALATTAHLGAWHRRAGAGSARPSLLPAAMLHDETALSSAATPWAPWLPVAESRLAAGHLTWLALPAEEREDGLLDDDDDDDEIVDGDQTSDQDRGGLSAADVDHGGWIEDSFAGRTVVRERWRDEYDERDDDDGRDDRDEYGDDFEPTLVFFRA